MYRLNDIILRGSFNYNGKDIKYKVYIKEKPLNVLGYVEYHVAVKYKKGLFSHKISLYYDLNPYDTLDWFNSKLKHEETFKTYVCEAITEDINR